MEEVTEIKCPNCNSDNIAKSQKPKSITGFFLVFFGLPLPMFKNEYHCFDCFNDFKIKNAS